MLFFNMVTKIVLYVVDRRKNGHAIISPCGLMQSHMTQYHSVHNRKFK